MSTAAAPPKVHIVVPAYNEARSIGDVLEALLREYENVIVVDDGSSDDTAARIASTDAHLVRHCLNRGQGAALQTGIALALAAGADVVVTFDSDGQHQPEDIAKLVAPVLAGDCDVALGSRFLGTTRDMPKRRWLVLKLGILFTRIVSRIRVTDVHNGLRAFSREAAQSLRITMDRMAHASEILDQIRANEWRFQEVPVTISYSTYSIEKGQRSSNAIRIGLQMILDKFS